jgi:hypothetical protein
VVATADDGGGMHACVGPTLNSHVDNSAPSSDLMSCISLFNKNYYSNSSADISRPVATVAQYIAMDQALPSLRAIGPLLLWVMAHGYSASI